MKTGPFAEHSSVLYGISNVYAWTKVNSGLIKMYIVEVSSLVIITQLSCWQGWYRTSTKYLVAWLRIWYFPSIRLVWYPTGYWTFQSGGGREVVCILGLQEKFEIDHSWEWKSYQPSVFLVWTLSIKYVAQSVLPRPWAVTLAWSIRYNYVIKGLFSQHGSHMLVIVAIYHHSAHIFFILLLFFRYWASSLSFSILCLVHWYQSNQKTSSKSRFEYCNFLNPLFWASGHWEPWGVRALEGCGYPCPLDSNFKTRYAWHKSSKPLLLLHRGTGCGFVGVRGLELKRNSCVGVQIVPPYLSVCERYVRVALWNNSRFRYDCFFVMRPYLGGGWRGTQQEFGQGGSADSMKPWPCSRHKRCKFCYPV